MATIPPRDMLKLIRERRTIRQFDIQKPIRKRVLLRILEAGTWAPYSPYAPMPWKFIAIQGKRRQEVVRHLLTDEALQHYAAEIQKSTSLPPQTEETVHAAWRVFARKFTENLGNAPVLVVGLVRTSEYQRVRQYNNESAWTAAQNMMLQACAEGLGSGLVTIHSEQIEAELIESLGLSPEKWSVAFIMNIGYPLAVPPARPRRDDLFEIME